MKPTKLVDPIKGDEELKAHERSGDEEPRNGVVDARK